MGEWKERDGGMKERLADRKTGGLKEMEGRKVRRARQRAQVMIALRLWWVGVRVGLVGRWWRR